MEANRVEIKPVLLSLSGIILLEAVSLYLTAEKVFNPTLSVGLARLLDIAWLIFVAIYWGGGLRCIGLAVDQLLPGFKKGLIWSAGFAVLVFFVAVILFIFSINPLKILKTNLPSSLPEILLFLIVGGLVGPVSEEMFFRGFLYGYLRRWGVFAAVLASTGLFVFAHSTKQHFPLTQAVGGVLFAVSYEFEKKLLVPVMIHCLGNLALFALPIIVV